MAHDPRRVPPPGLPRRLALRPFRRRHVPDPDGRCRPYLQGLKKRRGVRVSGDWSEATTSRVASGLLRIAADFGLLTGTLVKEFTPYHLPEESFLYLLHALDEAESNARKIIDCADWHMYLMSATDVERELLRLHQFRRLHYEVAGSLAQLDLPCGSTIEYAKELVS